MVTEIQQRISDVLAIAGSSEGPAVSEGDLLRTARDFANTSTLSGALLYIPGINLPRGIVEDSHKRGLKLAMNVSGDAELSRVREQFREDLAACVLDSPLPARTTSRLKRDASRIVMVPRYTFEKGSMRVSYHYLPEGLEPALAYSVLLLRDKSRPFRDDFARCHLERCGIFFFRSDRAEQTGRRGRSYCCPEHMQERHRETGADRVRRHRAKHK